MPFAAIVGQEGPPGPGSHVGGAVGVNLSDLNVDSRDRVVETETTAGFRAVAIFRWNISRALGLTTGAAYSQQGSSIRSGLAFAPPDVRVSLDYLELPLTASVTIPGTRRVAFRIHAGGSVNLELSCHASVTQGGEEFEESCETTPAELGGLGLETKSTSLDLLLGAGLDVGAGPGTMTLDIRYDHGLTDIVDGAPSLLDIHNESFQATVGYQFFIPR